jgi:hypothetical protein
MHHELVAERDLLHLPQLSVTCLKAEGASCFPGDIIHLHKMLSKYDRRFNAFLTCSWKHMARKELYKLCKVYKGFPCFLFEIFFLKATHYRGNA